ncbi:M23 family metallopeptidase [Vicingaceae bacterium]|nr:M23 family metallopeptidase [Vicingaceae bacterium]MDB4060789.1 M23 family metallopeptidase [Vicingaceae bacterium]
MEKETTKKRIIKRLKNKYRLVILNDASFEERFSYRLSPLNLLTLILSFVVVLIVLVSVVIIYTPLRESIPGYTDVSLREDLTTMLFRTDSLESELLRNSAYLRNIQGALKGELPLSKDSIYNANQEVILLENPLVKSKEDSMLREYVEREDSYSLTDDKENISKQIYFFAPLKGTITNEFDPSKEHFGIDVVAPKDEAIKATLDGTVVFAEWTVETGYVIQLQHANNIVSNYKHNSVLLKKVGDEVKAGDVIAIIGNSGELSSGPHLHFELWKEGKPINPKEFINF